MIRKRGLRNAVLFSLIIIILIAAVYFTFFFSYKCKDISCFQEHQKKCVKTKFVDDTEDITWEYIIKGKNNGICEIEVQALQIKKGAIDKSKLEGKSMNCYLPLGSTNSPQADIAICHGILKEELQNIIIQKLHSYIVENIGEIGEEIKKSV